MAINSLLVIENNKNEKFSLYERLYRNRLLIEEYPLQVNSGEEGVGDLLALEYSPELNLEGPKARYERENMLLFASESDLPAIFKSKLTLVFAHLLRKDAPPEKLIAFINRKYNGHQPKDDLELEPETEPLDAIVKILADTTGGVLRPLLSDFEWPLFSYVLPKKNLDEKRRQLIFNSWGNEFVSLNGHPLAEMIGQTKKHQVIRTNTDFFLGVFPWKGSPLLSIVVGSWSKERRSNIQICRDQLHAQLVEFPVPQIPAHLPANAPGYYSPEYDWIITEQYVGPDRRSSKDNIINRFTFRGRRRYLPVSISRMDGGFVDIPSKKIIGLILVYVILSLIDTFLTVKFIKYGNLSELNPLLRPILEQHSLLFILVKNIFSISLILLISRFEFFKIGFWVLLFNLMIYLVLDVYWMWLLFSHW